MKKMKKEVVEAPVKTRKSPSRKSSVGVILFCLGVMALSVAKGMKLDKEEAEKKAEESSEE